MKLSYISPDCGTLELTLSSLERPQGIISLDMGVPNWPAWNIRVPVDAEDANLILDMAFQAMAEDFLYFLISLGFEEDLAKSTFALVLLAWENIKSQDFPEMDGGSASLLAPVPLDQVFVEEIHRTVVTASPIKRKGPAIPAKKQVRRMEVVRQVGPTKALNEAKQIVQKYRNRSLKGQPRPMYLLVYDFNGKPIGVKKL